MDNFKENAIVCLLAISFIISYLSGYLIGKDIGAMEVYRGNTKLQYTIVDSVKVDSCVIFLNNKL